MKPSAELLDEIVERIREAAHPLRIILFGSAARDEMHENSDLDFLIVVRDDEDCRGVERLLHRRLRGMGFAKDIVVVRESDADQHQHDPYLVIHSAISQGKELYRAAT